MRTEAARRIEIAGTAEIKKGVYERYIKRPLDLCLALPAAIVLSPVLLATCLLVRLKLGSPVIFRQKRPGMDERIFTILKFRTMTDEKDENGALLPDDIRLTKFGRLLRSSSLDELPELINIIRGDMSIVGPRPQLVRDMVFMSEDQRRRHSVRPGLTGLAQIRGRNNVSWEARLNNDLEYIRKITFIGDLKIILLSVKSVFAKEGINTDGMATAEDFGDYLLRCGIVSEKEYAEKQEESIRLLMR